MSFTVFKSSETFTMIKCNGKLHHIKTHVHFAYDQDSDPPDFDYGSEAENNAELERFNRGELLNLCIKVVASALGETGSEYLGQCFVPAKTMARDLEQLAIEHDMKNRACIELREKILYQHKILNEALA